MIAKAVLPQFFHGATELFRMFLKNDCHLFLYNKGRRTEFGRHRVSAAFLLSRGGRWIPRCTAPKRSPQQTLHSVDTLFVGSSLQRTHTGLKCSLSSTSGKIPLHPKSNRLSREWSLLPRRREVHEKFTRFFFFPGTNTMRFFLVTGEEGGKDIVPEEPARRRESLMWRG